MDKAKNEHGQRKVRRQNHPHHQAVPWRTGSAVPTCFVLLLLGLLGLLGLALLRLALLLLARSPSLLFLPLLALLPLLEKAKTPPPFRRHDKYSSYR